jgi:RHS repeat-associated protein
MARCAKRYSRLVDGQGSTLALTDEAGNVVQRYSYDAFGNPTISGSLANPFLYTGQMWEPEAGLYYDRARWYEPQSGRFISRDPVAAINPYPYAKGDPTNARDPSGAFGLVEEESAMSVEGALLGVGIGGAGALALPNLGTITHFLWQHKHELIDGAIATFCLFGGAPACLGAAAAGYLGSSVFNGLESSSIGEALARQSVTLAQALLIGGGGLIYGGLVARGLITELDSTLGQIGLNTVFTWPSVVGVFLDEPMTEAILRTEQ